MPTVTLLPNADITNGWDVSDPLNGGTRFGRLSDSLDTSFITSPWFSNCEVAMSTFSLPAGSVVRRFRAVTRAASTSGGPARVQVLLGRNGGTAPSTSWWTGMEDASSISCTATITDYGAPWNDVALSQSEIDAFTVRLQALTGDSVDNTARVYQVSVEVVHVPPPTTAVSGPTGTITNTLNPTVTWTHTPGADAPAGQSAYQVRVFSQAQYSAGGFDPSTSVATWETSKSSGAATSQIINGTLLNVATYRAYVFTWQTVNGVEQRSAGAFSTFTLSVDPGVPVNVTPANGSTVNTSRPALNASVPLDGSGTTKRREWQFATNSGFTTGVLTITEPVSALSANPNTSFPFPGTSRLAQGTWFLRCRSIDNNNVNSNWSATNTITVSHVPTTTSRIPSGGSSVAYATSVNLDWTFSDVDTSDFQSRYRVQLWKLSDPVVSLRDSTLLVSAVQEHTFTGLDTTWRDIELRWRVLVHDQDNVAGPWSPESSFFLRDPATLNITAPTAAQVINTPSPLITWTFTASGGRTQSQWRIRLVNTSTSATVITSGWQTGTATSWQCPSPAVPVGVNFNAILDVIDSAGISSTFTRTFSASYTQPAGPTTSVFSSSYSAGGYHIIDWSSGAPSGTFVAWRLYRRVAGGAWVLIYSTTASAIRSFVDYTAPSGQNVEYTVVEAFTSSGFTLESAYTPVPATGALQRYMLTCPENPTLNMILYSVKGESFSDEQEVAAINLLGRGRRMEYGTRYGITGTLDVVFRDIAGGPTARQQRLQLEALRSSGLTVYLLNPFGDVYKVAMGTAQITRVAGLGQHEMVTASITYSEITA